MAGNSDSRMPDPLLRIAVADDEYELQHYFAKVLPYLGYQLVALVTNGEDLVRQCEQTEPDLVISDVTLSGMSGPEAVSVIRCYYPVAAIYITEKPFEDKAAAVAEYSVVLAKPFRMWDLTPAIDRAMTLSRHLQQRRGPPATRVTETQIRLKSRKCSDGS